MNEAKELLENFWIIKEDNRERYIRIKQSLDSFQKFFKETCGWRVIVNDKLIKVEKIPAQAHPFMGISHFQDVLDYILLTALLIFLEDKDEEQFLLSELISAIELYVASCVSLDFTVFSHRKSLVRVLEFAEDMKFLKVYDGKTDSLTSSINQEILYENTGLSRYFSTVFGMDVSSIQSVDDFDQQLAEVEMDKGFVRTNRIFRTLITCPGLYWSNNNQDGLYIKQQRSNIDKQVNNLFDMSLHAHKNSAFLVFEDGNSIGNVHPKESMLSDICLLFCALIRQEVLQDRLHKDVDETVLLSAYQFDIYLRQIIDKNKEFFSKEYRTMEFDELKKRVENYLNTWFLMKTIEKGYRCFPSMAKFIGEGNYRKKE